MVQIIKLKKLATIFILNIIDQLLNGNN